jgi:hypothetical protein
MSFSTNDYDNISCTSYIKHLFHKIKNAFQRKKYTKYQTKRKDLNSRLILGDD